MLHHGYVPYIEVVKSMLDRNQYLLELAKHIAEIYIAKQYKSRRLRLHNNLNTRRPSRGYRLEFGIICDIENDSLPRVA
jgi:hypothetical protein